MSAPIQPTGIDTRRVAQMVVYCLCAGLATGFAAWGAGATTKAAIAANPTLKAQSDAISLDCRQIQDAFK